MRDSLGDRIKDYERRETGRQFLPMLPVVARIDGRCFSGFTRGMARPYDGRFTLCMVDTAKYLVEQTHARIGYTQSDEINLVFHSNGPDSSFFFDGRVFKMTSVLASMATAKFGLFAAAHWPEKVKRSPPAFDARVFQVPSKEEAANAILWRELDATKNAISMAARAHYSHKALLNKNGAEMQEMLSAAGVNFNDYPARFKRGTFVQRRVIAREMDDVTWAKIPENKRPVSRTVLRGEVAALDMPPFAKVANRAAVIFDAARSEAKAEEVA